MPKLNDKVKQHTWHKCKEEHCSICDGGLLYCTVCHQGESELEDTCPGPKTLDPTVDLQDDLNLVRLGETTEKLPDLAVNLCDLDRVEPMIRSILLVGKINTDEWINTDPDRVDEGCVLFVCDLLTAACCVDTLRNKDKTVGRYPTRCCVRHATAWEKVPGNVSLTIVVNNEVKLNPEVFRIKPKLIQEQPPAKKKLPTKFGNR